MSEIANKVVEALSLEWGSKAQIDAENAVYELASQALGVTPDEVAERTDPCLKATLPEQMVEILELVCGEGNNG